MNRILSYIIAFSLVALVALILIRNKQQINYQIEFAERKVEAYPVKVTKAEPGTLDRTLELPGILSAADELMLMAETQGRIISILKQEGQWVQQGEVIARVDDTLMQAELLATENNYEKAIKDLDRALALSEGGAITQQQLEGLQLNAQAAESNYIVSRKRVEDATIRAPKSGFINKMFAREGGMIGPGVPVCELVNTKSLRMTAKADEQEIVNITPGQEVTIRVAVLNGKILSGKVLSTSAKADYALQYSIEIQIDENPGNVLRAGMVAMAAFKFKDELEGIIIPSGALAGTSKDAHVFVVSDQKATLVPVKVAHSSGNMVKISEGLRPEMLVVTAGQFNLSDGMAVKIID